jgi:hypothetical protein
MTLIPDWYGEEERERARWFRDLLETLREVLDEPQAFRIETAASVGAEAAVVPVYMVGKTKAQSAGIPQAEASGGAFAGVVTQVVET